MLAKVKTATNGITEHINSICDDWSDFHYNHPFLAGHMIGCVIVWWIIFIGGLMNPGKVLDWVDAD